MTRSLSCANCGAPLDIPNQVKYVTCEYCQSRLQVREAKGIYFTELMERLDRRYRTMQQDLAHIRRTQQLELLELLERQWERELENFTNERTGKVVIPKVGGIVVVLLCGCGLGLFGVFSGLTGSGSLSNLIFGILMILAGLYTAQQMQEKRTRYHEALEAYRAKRRKLEL